MVLFPPAGGKGREVELRITNCAGAAYPHGWEDYRACMSPTATTIRYTPASDSAWFAYFAPYSMERHHDLVARPPLRASSTARSARRSTASRSTASRWARAETQVWLYARQHPGESMAEWWMEGALEVLTDPADPVARVLRDKCRLHLVPNMNPDGSRRGHLGPMPRGSTSTANGTSRAPTNPRSPRVRNAMDQTGVDFAMDVHGDEAIAANFLAGFEGIPSWTEKQQGLFERFRDDPRPPQPRLPDRQGLSGRQPGKANLSMSTNQVAERFGAVLDDAGNAVQGQRRPARPGSRLVARPLPAARPGLPRDRKGRRRGARGRRADEGEGPRLRHLLHQRPDPGDQDAHLALEAMDRLWLPVEKSTGGSTSAIMAASPASTSRRCARRSATSRSRSGAARSTSRRRRSIPDSEFDVSRRPPLWGVDGAALGEPEGHDRAGASLLGRADRPGAEGPESAC
jgi:hypothetical protein